MSWLACAWAAQQKLDRPSDKLILLAFANCHNEETGLAYPSVAWLCEFSGLNRKTVIQCVSRLEAAGLLTDSGQRVGSTRQVKAYTVEVGDITVPKRGPLKSTVFSSKESQNRDTEPLRNLDYIKRGLRRCPVDWSPSSEDIGVAKAEGLDADETIRATTMFRDHTQSRDVEDWSGAYRNWMRKAGDLKRRDAKTGRKPSDPYKPPSLAQPYRSPESLARLEAIRNKKAEPCTDPR